MTGAAFDPRPRLVGGTVEIRPLAAGDLDSLHAAASDPATWAGHPAKDRHRREVFAPHFDILLASGTAVTILDRSGGIIGCSRYYAPPDRPDGIAIGFTFLDRRYWGGATNFEVKRLMLAHAFRSFPEVWFHIGPGNLRSRTATLRLGAVHVHDAELALAGAPARWMCFRLTPAAWEEARTAREASA